MAKNQKLLPKIVASIALLAIVIGIVGTGILVIFQSFFSTTSAPSLSQEELQQYLETLSGATVTGSGEALPTEETPESLSGTGS